MSHTEVKTDKSQTSRPDQLRVMFLTTSMPVGGAETLLANLVRRIDHSRFAPEIACLKERGPLGEELAAELPVYSNLISHKFDLRVLPRLVKLMRARQVAAVVTVGAGDKMFWGRIAARLARVPVVLSALHSTGWPDSIGRLNRWLTPLTDGFIGVADDHTKHLIERESFPREKVFCIYNGIDTKRFAPSDGGEIHQELAIPVNCPVVTILAALRPEKNHEFFLQSAKRIRLAKPHTHFLVVGDGPRRGELEELAQKLGISDYTHFVGSRSDVPQLLAASSVVALTSHNEASPVSILEALSCGVPVVSANVGSVHESVVPGETGYLFEGGNIQAFVSHTLRVLNDPELGARLGRQGREYVVRNRSLKVMVDGYQQLINKIYADKMPQPNVAKSSQARTTGAMDLSAT